MAPTPDRESIEALWRKRVADARANLYFARNYVKEVRKDLRSGAVPPPDGNFALARAMRVENLASAEYNRVLRIFRELLTAGKVPDESEWLERQTGDASGKQSAG